MDTDRLIEKLGWSMGLSVVFAFVAGGEIALLAPQLMGYVYLVESLVLMVLVGLIILVYSLGRPQSK